jgi:peptidoglycan hydrolase-like protein with peptidoglycan-binding domain
MSRLLNLSSMLLAATVVLYGCETPTPKSNAAPAAPQETKPEPAARPAPPRDTTPQAPAPQPEISIEGPMTTYELQDRLAALGYKPGVVDGVAGPKTIDALKSFQADNKLPATGNLDADTIRKLRTAKPSAVPPATKN